MKYCVEHIVASELKDPIWHSSEWHIGSFSSEATIYSLGAKFQKTAILLVNTKVVGVLEKYLQNIISVGVEVCRGSKVLRDVQLYHYVKLE